jgi:hypothetical protein
MKTAYHIGSGPQPFPFDVDADSAVRRYPAEWSFEPWPVEETNAYRRAQYEAAVKEAERTGTPPPPEPVDIELTPEDKATIDADEAARAEARELVAEADAEEAEQRDRAAKIAAARALLAQAPPQPSALAAEQAAREAGARPAPAFVLPDGWKDRPIAARRGYAIRLGAPTTITNKEVDAFLEGKAKPDLPQPKPPAAAASEPKPAPKRAGD